MLDNSNHFQHILNLHKGLHVELPGWLQEGRPLSTAALFSTYGVVLWTSQASCWACSCSRYANSIPFSSSLALRCSLFRQTWKTIPRICWALWLFQLLQKLGCSQTHLPCLSWARALRLCFCCLVCLFNHRLITNIIYPGNLGLTFFSSSQPHPGSHRILFNLSSAGSHLASLTSALVRPHHLSPGLRASAFWLPASRKRWSLWKEHRP